VLLGAKTEGVHVDTGVGGTGVVLERLDGIEVGTLTLGEAVLSVKLKLSGDDRVLTPAMHVKGSLGKDEGTGIGKTLDVDGAVSGSVINTSVTHTSKVIVIGTSSSGSINTTVCGNVVRKGVNSISVVERLGSVGGVKGGTGNQGITVVNVGIRLDDPDKLLTGVVEVELDLVGGGTDGLVTSELDLLDEVLVGVLCHLSTLIGIKEDIVNVKRSGNKGLLVSLGDGSRTTGSGRVNSIEALTDRTEVNVDLDLVVLKGNQRKSKSGVAAKPELKRHVKSGLRKGVAGSTHLVRGTGSGTGTSNIGASRGGNVSKLGGVTDHLVVTSLLLLGKGKLVPDVHPVTVLTVNALTSNLNLNLGDELLTDEI